MAFRDMLEGVHRIDDSVSVNHDMMDMSVSLGNVPLVFENIAESPGHRAALNVLERSRLCEMFEVSPGELIDILAWAMDNPSEPQIVGRNEAQVMESGQDSVDLEKLPIPWHFREDGGRYQSASIIIAEYGGVRNVSFHRQLLRDGEHTVARPVSYTHLTLTTKRIV